MDKKFQKLGFILAAIAILSFLGHLGIEVFEGRGGDIYKSNKELNFIPVGVLIFDAATPFFIGLANAVGWHVGNEERHFKQYLLYRKRLRNELSD